MAPGKISGKKVRNDTDGKAMGKRAQKVRHRSSFSDEKVQTGDAQETSRMPVELQQILVNIFRDTFSAQFGTHLSSLIQEVKQHLYNRDFIQAFGSQKYLEAYAIRWSPSRALAYLDILMDLPLLRDEIVGCAPSAATSASNLEYPAGSFTGTPPDTHVSDAGNRLEPSSHAPSERETACKVVCLGGGAGAEIVALAGFARHLLSSSGSATITTNGNSNFRKLAVTAVDIADWSRVVHGLYEGVTKPSQLSPFASSAAKAAKKPFIDPGTFSCHFHRQDLLELGVEDLTDILRDANMITIMFTLNELYSVSMAKTTNFLLALTFLLETGTLLLVVDSPGSYSSVAVGSSGATSPGEKAKKYPMQWLLDHTLLEASSIGSSRITAEGGQWEKILSENSRWFRVPEGLKYPVTLENMRYQIHLYRRL